MIKHSTRRMFSLQNKLLVSNHKHASRRKFTFNTESKIFKSTQRHIRGDGKDEHLDDVLKIIRMVRDIRRGGHFVATLDPLLSLRKETNACLIESARRSHLPQDSPRLPRKSEDIAKVAKFFGLDHLPLHKPFYLGGEIRKKDKVDWTITELIHFMNDCYCGNVGVEIQHIENAKERTWLQERVEGEFGFSQWNLSSPEEQRHNYTKLLESDHTSEFLAHEYHFTKIFELEGAESLLPGLWSLAQEFSDLGGEAIEMGEAGGRGGVENMVDVCVCVNVCVNV
jgi:2-oxoglutarate dehydrogenase E1 component